MPTIKHSLLSISVFILLSLNVPVIAEGPLPKFKFQGVLLHPNDLKYSPNDDLIHPTIIETHGRVKNPLGKFYLYHAPHKHISISMAYADRIEGPWKEFKANPVVKGPSAPDIRWIAEKKKFFMWGHRKNSQTELWTSDDGISFQYHSVSVKAANIGTRNATYSRVYEYPLKKYGSKYIMVYSGFIEDQGIRCVWLAHSKDAENWTQLKTPLVEPVEGEMNDCYGPALLRYKGKNYLTYQDHTTWRGGNLKYVELDADLNSVGSGGKRYVLMDPPSDPPFDFWKYFDEIPEVHFGGHNCSEGRVQSAYNDATGSYQHVLINSENQNVFMVLVLDLKSNSVYGHRLLDLNKEYGLDDEDFE